MLHPLNPKCPKQDPRDLCSQRAGVAVREQRGQRAGAEVPQQREGSLWPLGEKLRYGVRGRAARTRCGGDGPAGSSQQPAPGPRSAPSRPSCSPCRNTHPCGSVHAPGEGCHAERTAADHSAHGPERRRRVGAESRLRAVQERREASDTRKRRQDRRGRRVKETRGGRVDLQMGQQRSEHWGRQARLRSAPGGAKKGQSLEVETTGEAGGRTRRRGRSAERGAGQRDRGHLSGATQRASSHGGLRLKGQQTPSHCKEVYEGQRELNSSCSQTKVFASERSIPDDRIGTPKSREPGNKGLSSQA